MFLPPMDWIERVIKIPSLTHETNSELVHFLVPLLEETGLKVFQHTVKEQGKTFVNLIAYNQALDSPGLLVLNTHLDTVSPGDQSLWTKTDQDPFQLTRVRDRLYGLGTADVKIDFLCKIWAARLAKPWKRPFALVGTYGEERGLVGIRKLLEEKNIKPRFALVGEPSNLELIYAHKGHLVFTYACELDSPKGASLLEREWKGKAAHSSTPDLGLNALRKALTDIFKRGYGIVELNGGTDSNRIPDSCKATLTNIKNGTSTKLLLLVTELDELARELKKRKDSRFSPSSASVSLNKAVSHNGKLILTFDIRTLPGTKSAQIQSQLDQIAKRLNLEIDYLSIDIPLSGHRIGKLIQSATEALKASGVKKPACKTKASSTEAAVYQSKGAEAIVFGPGLSIGNVHRPNEYNSLRQIKIATKFYTHILRNSELGV